MGMFSDGGQSLAPFLDAAKEANRKGNAAIADFEGVAQRFAAMGQGNYEQAMRMYGPWQNTMDSYYRNLKPDEVAAQNMQQIQVQYQNQMKAVTQQFTSQGINPASGISLGGMEMLGMANAQSQAQGMTNAGYDVASQQQGYAQFGGQQIGNAFNQMGMGVTAQGNVANQYSNLYAGFSNTALQLASQQQQANEAAAASTNSLMGGLGSLAGTGIGFMVGGPAGAVAGQQIGGAAGGAAV